jgi:hypothetical protein
MTRSTIQRIATLGLAAVAVTAIGGTASSASDPATTRQTWHPRIIVSDRYQHTWNPAGDRSDASLSPSPTTP